MKIKIFNRSELKFVESLAVLRAGGKTYLKSSRLMCSKSEDNSAYDKNFQGHYMGVAGRVRSSRRSKRVYGFYISTKRG